MGLLPWTAKVTADRLQFAGRELLGLGKRERRKIIGKDIAMIFQEPMSSLNPCFKIGYQLTEALKAHLDLDKAARRFTSPLTTSSLIFASVQVTARIKARQAASVTRASTSRTHSRAARTSPCR